MAWQDIFKSTASSVVLLLILVVGQTVAAPAYDDVLAGLLVAKRGGGSNGSSDKGHPPAAAADWIINEEMQQFDVAVADLEKLKQTTHHNVELDLKQDHDKWQLKAIEPLTTTTVARDELTEELKKLEQDEEEAKFIEGKEQEHEESAVGQPTVQEMQQEQQRIDDEIQSEINKDEMETMETIPSSVGGRQEQFAPPPPSPVRPLPLVPTVPSAPHSDSPSAVTVGPITTTTGVLLLPLPRTTASIKSLEQVPLAVVVDDADVSPLPINQQEEQLELLKKTPHQNEDFLNFFTKNGNRRSSGPALSIPGRTRELKVTKDSLLKSAGGRQGGVSAHDLSQYVFWTGDEAGVAKAIEDLIDEGVMSRENAIKFLRDIRGGIEALQNAYAPITRGADRSSPLKLLTTNALEEERLQQQLKPVATTKFLRQFIPGTVNPKPPKVVEWNLEELMNSPVKIEETPTLLKLNEMIMNRNEDNSIGAYPDSSTISRNVGSYLSTDDANSRLRMADLLYADYSLEDVIYELAKVMFAQALAKGSEPAQEALQKFIGFIEIEASQGRISPSLQKKVIDVLMTALSDTIAEHPDLLVMARAYLEGASLNRLGVRGN